MRHSQRNCPSHFFAGQLHRRHCFPFHALHFTCSSHASRRFDSHCNSNCPKEAWGVKVSKMQRDLFEANVWQRSVTHNFNAMNNKKNSRCWRRRPLECWHLFFSLSLYVFHASPSHARAQRENPGRASRLPSPPFTPAPQTPITLCVALSVL